MMLRHIIPKIERTNAKVSLDISEFSIIYVRKNFYSEVDFKIIIIILFSYEINVI